MKKRIILPVYNDLHDTNGWEKKYQKDPDCEVLIYEKDDSLEPDQCLKTDNGYKIPNIGRSSYVFLYHICKYYGKFADVEIFTKTHIQRQQINIQKSISESENFYHLQAINNLRGMLYVEESFFRKNIESWSNHPNAFSSADYHVSLRDTCLDDFFPNLSVNFANFSSTKLNCLYIYKCVDGITSVPANDALKEVFSNYDFPHPFYLRRENVWSVKRDLIEFYSLDFYQKMLQNMTDKKYPWNMDHDQWCEFWPIFWEKTIEKMKVN